MDTVFIYALNDPDTGRTRYVGKAGDPQSRFQSHLDNLRFDKTRKARWIRSLLAGGRKPVLEILDEVPVSEWPQWEVAYIQFFQEGGFDLTNGTAGGEGVHNPSEETRAKLREAALGNKKGLGKIPSFETRAKISAANMGNKNALGAFRSPETRAKIRATKVGEKNFNFGKKDSEETRAKKSLASQGNKRAKGAYRSPEFRARVSAALLGRSRGPMSEEQKAKLSAAKTGRKFSPEARANMRAAQQLRRQKEKT